MADNPFDSDTSIYRNSRIAALQGRFAWASSGVEVMADVERYAWQSEFRARFAEALGGLDNWERPALEPEIGDVVQLGGYSREAVSFATRPGLRACGYFLVPDGCAAGQPGIVCLPGHGRGVDSIVGIAADGSQRSLTDCDEYAQDFALQCVRSGFPVFALEQVGFGQRRDAAAKAASPEASSCVRDSMAALMLGETMAGWRAWDAMRALDFLQSRADFVDPERLAVMGISGGGMTALFTAALDNRVSACVVSGYFNTFADSVLTIDHCVDNYVPGLLALCEMPDLAALIAPRMLLLENGVADPIFPLAAFVRAVERAREIYRSFGAPEQLVAEVFEGGHQFHGVKAFEGLTRLMHGWPME